VEQSELRSAAVNELLTDAAIRLDERTRAKGEIEFRLSEVPPVICRPQQLTTVFGNLLSNALNALNGSGKVVVATARHNHDVEITIRDEGRGMNPEQLENIFDPSFRIDGGRVGTGNWTLFNTRQIIFEHGGDIAIDSTEGRGTTVRVLLPS
jgi:two-component system, NtrC family, sensor kinase